MDLFTRKANTACTTTQSVYELISSRKLVVENPMAVAHILLTWEHAGLWKWKVSVRNKGPHGLPAGLYNGVHYIDKLLSGKPIGAGPIYESAELYGDYIGKHWRTSEIVNVIQDYAKAAFSSDYAPIAPADKERLQKRNLAEFFYAGYIEVQPSAYIHAPFIYYFRHGAEPAIAKVTEKTPLNYYLFSGICGYYTRTSGMVLSVPEKNRVVNFTDTLYHWYTHNSHRLPPNDRRLDVIIEAWQAYLATWPSFPQTIIPAVGRVATDTVLAALQKKAVYVERTVAAPTVSFQPVQSGILPTSVLNNIAPDGNYLGVLTTYCEQNDVEFMPQDVDSDKLSAYGHMQVRQVLRQYRLGTFKKTAPVKRDWRDVLKQYGDK